MHYTLAETVTTN